MGFLDAASLCYKNLLHGTTVKNREADLSPVMEVGDAPMQPACYFLGNKNKHLLLMHTVNLGVVS